jgi:hypothetical protein
MDMPSSSPDPKKTSDGSPVGALRKADDEGMSGSANAARALFR